jgi:two-component system, NtrC family, nitrogen regulation sensor histidine kinase NtrY
MAATSDSRDSAEQGFQRLGAWARRVRLSGKLVIALAVASALSGLGTYLAWTGVSPHGPNPRFVLILLVVDLILLLALGAVIARQLVRLWVERRSGSAGSRLHLRFVALFSLVAVAPAIVTAVFSAAFFHLGIQSWFSDSVRTVVRESLAVAEAYVAEHRETIRADILAMANDLSREAPQLARNPQLFNRVLQTQAALRSLSEATVFDSTGRILARTALSLTAAFETVPLDAVSRANDGEIVVFSDEDEDQVHALIRLERFLDAYLYVGRFVDAKVLNHAEKTREVVAQYEALEGARSGVQLTAALIFMVVALLLLVVAVWMGLVFANRLVRPITALVVAAERVRQGELDARVAEVGDDDEIATLSRAFNRMTHQLASQRAELVEANRQLDRRRRFTEAVLAGVSAGVIGLDRQGRITLPNRSAAELLGAGEEDLVGRMLEEAAPELAPVLEEARSRPDRFAERQVTIARGGRRRTLIARVAGEVGQGDSRGYVATLDDVTDLMTAQRTAAWADVARRIAHEIKNPLTPIQLSAERLRRKYGREVTTDPEVFAQCTDTIIRQVGDIGRMVDEFSAFARMPAPVFKQEDLRQLVRQNVFAQQVAHPEIEYAVELPEAPTPLRCDARQVAQVLTNLLKNAAEAIEGRPVPADGGEPPRGQIAVRVLDRAGEVVVEVADNGRGLPAEHRDRLTEPYVTTRMKGTGLGLAIVRKIMEDHGGRLSLEDGEGGGAKVTLTFVRPAAAAEDSVEAKRAAHGA